MAAPPSSATLKKKSHKFKGVRFRKWGKWAAEIRVPNSRKKIWLGSFSCVEQAAKAYDAALYCLRGPNSRFNFPDSPPSNTIAYGPRTLEDIRTASWNYAIGFDSVKEVAISECCAVAQESSARFPTPVLDEMDSSAVWDGIDFGEWMNEFVDDCFTLFQPEKQDKIYDFGWLENECKLADPTVLPMLDI